MYYSGTAAQWAKVNIGEENSPLKQADWVFQWDLWKQNVIVLPEDVEEIQAFAFKEISVGVLYIDEHCRTIGQ